MLLNKKGLPPTPHEFRVWANQIEHNLIVANLIAGDSIQSETKSVIAAKNPAYDNREYAKSSIVEWANANSPKK